MERIHEDYKRNSKTTYVIAAQNAPPANMPAKRSPKFNSPVAFNARQNAVIEPNQNGIGNVILHSQGRKMSNAAQELSIGTATTKKTIENRNRLSRLRCQQLAAPSDVKIIS